MKKRVDSEAVVVGYSRPRGINGAPLFSFFILFLFAWLILHLLLLLTFFVFSSVLLFFFLVFLLPLLSLLFDVFLFFLYLFLVAFFSSHLSSFPLPLLRFLVPLPPISSSSLFSITSSCSLSTVTCSPLPPSLPPLLLNLFFFIYGNLFSSFSFSFSSSSNKSFLFFFICCNSFSSSSS